MFHKGSIISTTTKQRNAATATANVAARVVGYARVSTDGQAQEGVSLAAQRARLEAYAQAMELDLVEVLVDEGASAGTLKRAGLQRALKLLETGAVGSILVTKLDRLTRSVRDLAWLVEHYFFDGRCSLLSVSDSIDTRSPSGRLVMNLIVSVAQWEREAISERTKEALTVVRSQGYKFGAPPLGFRFSTTPDEHGRRVWVEDPTEQEALRRLLELHDAGKTVIEITAQLTADGWRLRKGGSWHKQRVYRTLKLHGRLPLVMRAGGTRKRPAEEQPHDRAACRRVAEVLRGQGLGLRAIIAVLEKQRLSPPRGQRWHASTVATMLQGAQA